MIHYITWGDINQASSRLRVFNIIPHLENAVIGIPDEYTKEDTLVIQKYPAIDELRIAKKAGARVVYDIDDYFWNKKEYMEMVKEADWVTVDTESKKNLLLMDNPNITVIPDSLDWNGTIKENYEHKGIIGWTGYGMGSAYLNDIILPKEMQLRLITDTSFLGHYKGLVQSRPWSIAKVDKYLSECDLGVYFLPEGQFEQVKGMHKLLKNWAIGLPTYTTAMPDYVKAMHEAGVGDKYIIKTGEEIKDIEFDPKLREYAFKYKADIIAKKWEKVIKDLLRG